MSVQKLKKIHELSQSTKLRFKEFTNNFDNLKLQDISKLYKGSGLTKETMSENGKNYCIHYGELFTKLRIISNNSFSKTNEKLKYFSKGNELLISTKTSGYSNVFNWISVKTKNIAIGDAINIFDINKNFNSDYLSLVLNSKENSRKVSRLIEGTIARQLLSKYLLRINILVTKNNDEQDKIVDFFTKIFKKIDSENNVKNKWELLLKSITEKTFEKNKDTTKYYIFKDELNIFFDKFSGLSGVTADNFKEIGKKYLPYKKIYDKKICNELDLLDVNFENRKQNKIIKNDILLTQSSETQDEVGISSLYNSNYSAYLNSFCFGIRLKEEFIDKIYPKYVNSILSFSEYRKAIFKLSNGTTRYNLSPGLFTKLFIKIPNWETQIKISNIYYNIINLIETQTKLIQKIETLKKHFLNSFFLTK